MERWSRAALIEHIRADLVLRKELGLRVAVALEDENIGSQSDRTFELEQRAICAVVAAAVRVGEELAA